MALALAALLGATGAQQADRAKSIAIPSFTPDYRGLLDGSKPLPTGWTSSSRVVAPADMVVKLGAKFGAELASVTNSTLALEGAPIQINVLEAKSAADAATAYAALVKARGNPAFVQLDDVRVIEFTRTDTPTLVRAWYDLGFKPRRVTWRVSFEAAPVLQADEMKRNELFNAFLALARGEADAAPAIDRLAAGFRFGGELTLRDRGLGASATTWKIESRPAKRGVPAFAVSATITSEAFAITPAQSGDDAPLVSATPAWPADDPEIVALAQQVVGDAKTPRAKCDALLGWFAKGKALRFGGDVVGSRYGVKAALKQGCGHCFDFADLFITLARAAKLPTREVFGWIAGHEGHVWVEVRLAEGFLAVDPTGGTLCGSDYLPFADSADGAMGLLYLGPIAIEAVESAAK